MKLSQFFSTSLSSIECPIDPEVLGLSLDSRQVKVGDLFAYVPGIKMEEDTRPLLEALEKGASVVLYDPRPSLLAELAKVRPQEPRLIPVPELGKYLGQIASQFYARPSDDLKVIGVTGTNGKSSITQYIAQALAWLKIDCAVLGTLGNGFLPELKPTTHTTLQAFELQRLLHLYQEDKARYVAMEVSSHGLDQGRVNGTRFDTAIFTNLTQDHLDYHHTMEAYGAAKAKLFEMEGLRRAILNADDPFSQRLALKLAPGIETWTYSLSPGLPSSKALFVDKIRYTAQGIEATVMTPLGPSDLSIPLIGDFNLANVLAVIAFLLAEGFHWSQIREACFHLRPVEGRMTLIKSPHQPTVVIDYAHTPDALKAVLSTLTKHNQGKLYCVFGCGGNRDAAKRPLMGAMVEQYTTDWIVTNDNPRKESPERIAQDILSGMQVPQRGQVILDRAIAIQTALVSAKPEDWILIAGKGHELEQEINEIKYPFSDKMVVIDYWKGLQEV